MPVTQTVTFSVTPPAVGDTPDTFESRAVGVWNELKNTTVPNMNTAFGQLNTLETNINAKEASAVAASAAAVSAAATAQSTANAAMWVSGQAYAAGQSAISGIDFQTYRANTSTSGTTDPSLSADWMAITDPTALQKSGGAMTGYFAEKSVAIAASDINWALGNHFTKTITAGTTLTFSNLPANGTEQTIILNLTNAGSQTVTFPTINWIKPDGTVTNSLATYLTSLGTRPALQTSGNDVFVFWVSDGTTVRGKIV